MHGNCNTNSRLHLKAERWAIFRMMGPNHPDNSKNLIRPDSIRRKSSRPETLCGKSRIPWDVFYAIPVAPGSKINSKFDSLTDFRDLGYSAIFPIILSLRGSLLGAQGAGKILGFCLQTATSLTPHNRLYPLHLHPKRVQLLNFTRCLQGAYRKLHLKFPGSVQKYDFRRFSKIVEDF